MTQPGNTDTRAFLTVASTSKSLHAVQSTHPGRRSPNWGSMSPRVSCVTNTSQHLNEHTPEVSKGRMAPCSGGIRCPTLAEQSCSPKYLFPCLTPFLPRKPPQGLRHTPEVKGGLSQCPRGGLQPGCLRHRHCFEMWTNLSCRSM